MLSLVTLPILSPGTYPPLSKVTLHTTAPDPTQLTPNLCSTSHLNVSCPEMF